MERLGGNAPAMQMIQWAQEKGIDIQDMNDEQHDRSMLFLQRQLGLGRDDADDAVNWAKNLPRLLQQQRQSGEDDSFHQKVALQHKQMGLEGIKTRFDQAKEGVNSKLQKVSQSVMQSGLEMVDSFFARLADRYTQTVSEKADSAYRSAMFGGASAQAAYKTYFDGAAGLAGKASGGLSGLGVESLEARFSRGSQGDGMASFGKMFKGISIDTSMATPAGGDVGDSGQEFVKFLRYGQSPQGKMKDAGYDLSGLTGGALTRRLGEISDMVRSVSNEAPSADLIALGKQNAKWMNASYATNMQGLRGADRVEAAGAEIMQNGTAALKERWANAKSLAEKAAVVNGGEVGAGIAEQARLGANVAVPETGVFAAGFRGTETERSDAYAAAFGGNAVTPAVDQFGRPTLLQHVSKDTGTADMRRGLGEALGEDTYREAVHRVFSSDAKTREAGVLGVQQDIQALEQEAPGKATGKVAALQGLLAAKEYTDLGGKATDEQANKILEKYGGLSALGLTGGGKAGIETMIGTLANIDNQKGNEITISEARRRRSAGEADEQSYSRLGIASFEGGQVKLSAATLEGIKGIKGGKEVLEAAIGATATEAGLSITDAGAARSGLDKSESGYRAFEDQLAGMSVADKRKLAAASGGTVGAMIGESATTQAGLEKGLKRGVLSAGASGLGITLTADEKKKYGLGKSRSVADAIGGDTDAAAEFLTERLGVKGGGKDDLQKEVKDYLVSLRTGNAGAAGKHLEGIMSNEEVQKAQKEQKGKQEEARDPLQAAIKKNTEDASKYLEALLKSSDRGNAELDKLNQKKGDPEDSHHSNGGTRVNNPSDKGSGR
jgi:hypothetical protein